MRKEISEQPEAIRRTFEEVQCLASEVRALGLQNRSKIIFLARGTSDNVAGYGLFLIPIVSGKEAYSLSPSLLNNYEVDFDFEDTLVVAISQSGETHEIVNAARIAKERGAQVLGITNNAESSLEKVADICLVTPAGKELAVPATKTYTTALAGLAALVAEIYESNDLKRLLADVPAHLEGQLSAFENSKPIVQLLAGARTAVFAGRGLAMGATFEAALKLKETAAINVIGASVADFVHGPIAALTHEVPLVVFSADVNSPIYPGLVDLIKRATVTGSTIVTYGDFFDSDKSELHLTAGQLTGRELLAPLLLAIPSQLIAAAVSDAKGLNADAPTVLNKVTQTT